MSAYEGLNTPSPIHDLESVADLTVLGNDTTNLATSTAAPLSDAVVEFDKADGAAGTVYAAAYGDPDCDIGGPKPTDLLSWWLYVSAVTDIAYAFVRLGVDSSNYNEYQVADSALAAGWNWCKVKLGTPTSVTGTGMAAPDTLSGHRIRYMVIGVGFDGEANTLADIKVWRLQAIPCSIVEDV